MFYESLDIAPTSSVTFGTTAAFFSTVFLLRLSGRNIKRSFPLPSDRFSYFLALPHLSITPASFQPVLHLVCYEPNVCLFEF